jgi:hypothetical protein
MNLKRTEGHHNPMTRRANALRRWIGGAAVVATAFSAVAATAPAAMAQGGGAASAPAPLPQAPLPANVLLFPAVITGPDNTAAPMTPATKLTQEIVTEAVRKYLTKGGVGVIVYSNRLPSIQRAANTGEGGLKPEDLVKGPGDDPRLAARFADLVGAKEYILVSVDDYAYDAKTGRATFNLSLVRSDANGTPLGTSAEKAVGEAPADVAASRKEESASARASELAAEKTVISIYPSSAALINPPKMDAPKKKKRSNLGYIIPAIALGAFLIVPR